MYTKAEGILISYLNFINKLRLIECNEDPNYNEILNKDLDTISKQEMWEIKQEIKKLKSENKWNGFLL